MPNAPVAAVTITVSAAKTAATEAATATSEMSAAEMSAAEMSAMATEMTAGVTASVSAAMTAVTAAMTAATDVLDLGTIDTRREGSRNTRRYGWNISQRHRIGRAGRGREQNRAHDETRGASENRSFLHHLSTSFVLTAGYEITRPGTPIATVVLVLPGSRGYTREVEYIIDLVGLALRHQIDSGEAESAPGTIFLSAARPKPDDDAPRPCERPYASEFLSTRLECRRMIRKQSVSPMVPVSWNVRDP